MIRLFALLCFLPLAAMAEPRPIDMTVILQDDHGQPMKDPFDQTKDDPDCAKCSVLTLGHAVAHALFFKTEELDGDQKWARGVLAEKVRDAKAAELSVEETAVIKKVVGKVFGGLVLVQAYPLLDPNAQPPKVQ